MMATLGHELQHAVEVARAPHVTSGEAFWRYYRHIGIRGVSDHWDAREARHAGRVVARELALSDRRILARSPADPGVEPPARGPGTGARRRPKCVNNVSRGAPRGDDG
jgi:hypothetical protein